MTSPDGPAATAGRAGPSSTPGVPRRHVTELRIHGVSGTPPESMLQHPHVQRVAGDAKAGFYRRWLADQPPRDGNDNRPDEAPEREAYSWGGLTSGAGSRALWLLLLPFAFVNLASWTEPGDPDTAIRRRRLLEALLRLFAITLTLTFVLAVATMSMDLLAWQCAVPGSHCAAQDRLAGWLSRLGGPARRCAVGALVPGAMVGLLWYLGHRTWRDYERKPMPPNDQAPMDYSLSDPRFWNGDQPVRRLQALHITSAWMLLALLVADPARESLRAAGSPWADAAVVAETVAAVVGVSCLALSMWPAIADRRRSAERALGEREGRLWRWLPTAGLLVFCGAFATAAWPHTPEGTGQGAMPLLSGLLHTGFAIQAVLLIVLLVLNALLPRDPEQLVPLAVRGCALPLFATVGWLLAGGFAAGIAVSAAEWLGKPVADGASHDRELAARAALEGSDELADRVAALSAPEPLFVPAPFTWVALIAAVLALVVLPVLLFSMWYRLKRLTAVHCQKIEARNPAADPLRVRAVARARALAALSDYAPRYLGRAVLAASVLVIAGTFGYAFGDRSWPQDNVPTLTALGSLAMGAVALLLVALGRAAYRTPQLRRTVGILWDLASFWPRAAHPLAPPCYSERVLPDLVERTQALTSTDRDRLLVSAHSQGTVIALAAILQMPPETAQRSALLTYGSPLTRLYASFFPGYVNRTAYERAMRHLGATTESTANWPWRNLYRLTDPIGGPVLAEAEEGTAADEVDRQLTDPVFDRLPGDPAWPATRGHSDYWLDEEFEAAARRVLELRG